VAGDLVGLPEIRRDEAAKHRDVDGFGGDEDVLMVAPVCIAERVGVDAVLLRGLFLIKGHRWQIFAASCWLASST
jgi:hypothetical protein